jgi:ribosome biogenesis GTPase A
MAKTRRQIEEDLKLIDVVIELLDARIPVSSQNPDVRQIIKNKKRLVILNKADLAEDIQNKKWQEHFENEGIPCGIVDSNSGFGVEKCISKIEKLMEDTKQSFSEKGRIGRKIRVMIIGIPNVGKSSFINRIAKKSSAEVGNKPGVTRSKQWIRINDKIELMDTPGILWPKFESNMVALNLSFTGTIKEEILDRVEIAYQLLKYLLENNFNDICKRYNLVTTKIEEILKQDNPENENIYEVMQLIGKARGAIISGGNVDDEKTAKIILDDFRTLKFGKITLEKCK